MTIAYAFIAYIAVMSLILCILMYSDKKKARERKWRISESTLFTVAILGGAIGGVLGMYLFRHKTKHNSFAFGFPLMAAIQLYIIMTLLK